MRNWWSKDKLIFDLQNGISIPSCLWRTIRDFNTDRVSFTSNYLIKSNNNSSNDKLETYREWCRRKRPKETGVIGRDTGSSWFEERESMKRRLKWQGPSGKSLKTYRRRKLTRIHSRISGGGVSVRDRWDRFYQRHNLF